MAKTAWNKNLKWTEMSGKNSPHWKHGLSQNNKTYVCWRNMKSRCDYEDNDMYYAYGGRGVKYCKRWNDFINFYKDMGDKPINKSLDRINSNGNYSKSNCRWSSNLEQANNKNNNCVIFYDGVKKTLPEWAREKNIKRSTLSQRFYVYKWDIDRCLNTPTRRRGGQVGN